MNQFEMKQSAYQSQLKNRALQVLLYLIDRSNREQTCFPAVSTIGRELHISISTVKRAMRELVEAGYVAKESRFREGNRGQTSNLYTLHFPEEEGVLEQTVMPEKDAQMGQPEQTGEDSADETQEYKELLCEEQYAGRPESARVTGHMDSINKMGVVLENRYGLLELIRCCINKNNVRKTAGFATTDRNKSQGHLSNEESTGIIGNLLQGGRIIILTVQWTGEGVSLIPP